MTDLKPCPDCSGTNLDFVPLTVEANTFGCWCKTCGLCIAANGNSKEQAADSWNNEETREYIRKRRRRYISPAPSPTMPHIP